MNIGRSILPLMLAASLCVAIHADDKAPGGAKAEAPKEETWKGQVASSEGKTVLKVKNVDPKIKDVKTYTLWAEGDAGKQLAEILKKKSEAEVTGVLAPDGVNVKVSKVREIEGKGKKKK